MNFLGFPLGVDHDHHAILAWAFLKSSSIARLASAFSNNDTLADCGWPRALWFLVHYAAGVQFTPIHTVPPICTEFAPYKLKTISLLDIRCSILPDDESPSCCRCLCKPCAFSIIPYVQNKTGIFQSVLRSQPFLIEVQIDIGRAKKIILGKYSAGFGRLRNVPTPISRRRFRRQIFRCKEPLIHIFHFASFTIGFRVASR
jgi:hypothetical protein